MLKLKKPQLSDMVFESNFSPELDFLADKGKTYITIKCRAGGWANPDLTVMREQVVLYQEMQTLKATKMIDNEDKYTKFKFDSDKEVGKKLFEALYDTCVVSWETNIQNDGTKMICDKEHFLELADVKINELSEFFMDWAKYVDELGNFRQEVEEETVKN